MTNSNEQFNKEMAKYFDHTILKPETTLDQVERVCKEAIKYGFASVCVPPSYVEQAAEWVKAYEVKVATVVGYPMGYTTTAVKLAETINALGNGCEEVDFVINFGAVKEGRWDFIERELNQITKIVSKSRALLNVIIESALLEESEIRKICEICAKLGVDFVETSTGFNGEDVSVEMVQLMREMLPENIRIKAAGGIETSQFAQELIEAGADRLGSSASVQIVTL